MPKKRLNLADKIKEDEKNLYNGQLVYVAVGWKQEIIALGTNPDRVHIKGVTRGCIYPMIVKGAYYKN